MDSDPQLIINSAADLRLALRWRGTVMLRLPFWSADFQQATEKRLNFWYRVCGCHIGALALLITLALRIPALLRVSDWTLTALGREAGIALLAALVGKVAAIIGARILLTLDIARLQRRARYSQTCR